MRFYLVAMTFIVLDVEIIFLYPFSTVFRDLGGYGLGLMGVFLLMLIVPFAYLLSVGRARLGPGASGHGPRAGTDLRTTTVPSGIPSTEVAETEDEAA